MNQLIAVINWERTKETIRNDKGIQFSHLELRVERMNNFTHDGLAYYCNSDTGNVVSIIGYISNIAEVGERLNCPTGNDVEIVESLYSKRGWSESLFNELDGVFFVLIYDSLKQKVFLGQSEFGCPLPVYHTGTPHGIVISTTLKALLKESGIKREFDLPAVRDFITCGEMVPCERTFIKNVHKLVTQRNAIIDISLRNISYVIYSPNEATLHREDAEMRLIDSIGDSMKRMARQLNKKKCALTLTGGFDSNLLLSFLNRENLDEILTVTVNGGDAINEVPSVKHVLEFYSKEKVTHFIVDLPLTVFSQLPCIVWIYEGYIFQTGVLLRYVLSKMLGEQANPTVFLGSGADPVLNTLMGPGGNKVYEPYGEGVLEYFREMKLSIRNILKKNYIGDMYFYFKGEDCEKRIKRKCLRPGYRRRFNRQIDYNMKMHEIMLNSFNVQGLYPFINKETTNCAKPLRPWNNEKALYREKVKSHLGDNLSSVLKKSGAVVDRDSIFKNSSYWLEKVAHSDFIELVLPSECVKKIRKCPRKYGRILFNILALQIFEKLILSGDYDSQFDEKHINLTLEQVLLRK